MDLLGRNEYLKYMEEKAMENEIIYKKIVLSDVPMARPSEASAGVS